MNTNLSHQDEKIKFEEIIKENVSLSKFTTFKTGGIAEYYCEPGRFEELITALNFANINNLKINILGAGSNVIISDKKIKGLTIRTHKLCRYSIRGNIFSCRTGMSLDRAINITQNDGMLGLEGLSGIPGSIGGAVHGNAGAYGYTISDRLLYIDYITFDGKTHRMDRNGEDFGYRDSPFKHMENAIIFEAGFFLDKNNYSAYAKAVKDENTKNRIDKGLLKYPSAGSIFKNPDGYIAGKLIEDCNLKIKNINDAFICESHCNYIMNKKNATSKDIYELSKMCKKAVKDKFNIELEYEVQFIGDFS
ncbi:MAG: UDP-N-acetylmuramate dehydrogenase [Pleomorphochaeta sp.]